MLGNTPTVRPMGSVVRLGAIPTMATVPSEFLPAGLGMEDNSDNVPKRCVIHAEPFAFLLPFFDMACRICWKNVRRRQRFAMVELEIARERFSSVYRENPR
jgi:hypothetical protein